MSSLTKSATISKTNWGLFRVTKKAIRGKSETEKNALNVRLELQADYYAGMWARYIEEQGLMDTGDIEEALNAAHAVGDDTLQEQAYGYSVP